MLLFFPKGEFSRHVIFPKIWLTILTGKMNYYHLLHGSHTVYIFKVFLVLGIEFKTLCLRGRCCATQLYPWP